ASFANKSFYQNAIVEKFASKETKLVTLRQLTVFGRHLTFEKLIRSANYVREELPVRLAHRIIDIQHLPFIVGTNPHIQLIYSLYWQAFEAFRTFPEIKTLEQNRQFCDLIESQLQTHLVIIPQLAMGMAEASTPEHMTSEMADRFLNEMLRSRIGRRVLAEQHIALSDTYEQSLATKDGWIGIVNTRCKAAEVVERVSVLAKRWFRDTYSNRGVEPPEVIIDGHAHAVFTYIPDHIEYILFELFKNSMRFTLETHGPEIDESAAKTATSHLPAILVTVGSSRNDITFRISDQGGGFAHSQMQNLWSYTHASQIRHTNESTSDAVAGTAVGTAAISRASGRPFELEENSLHLGLGLPMSRVYANYWGGTIGVHSMHGYGTDAYVKISTGNQMEQL
ncbi:branched-chain alpha-ketoacid dehydrogenase, partial [Obelidium mucronatum]